MAAGQLATALVLLVSAALLGRSLLRVLSTDAGFRIDRVLTMELRPPETPDNLQRVEFLNQLLAQLRGIPGVEEVGGINDLPLVEGGRADGTYVVMNPTQVSPRMQELIERSGKADFDKNPELLRDMTTFFEDLMRDRAHLGDADFAVVSEGFFKTLSIPLVRGRLFNDNDTMDAAHVAVVSESLAKEKWPNQDPIGRTVEFGNMDGDLRLLTIVGVVGDIRDHSLESAPHPTVYVNYRQRPRGAWRFAVVMRASGQAEGIFSAARRIVHNLDPGIPPEFRTLSQVYSNSLEARRFSVTLVGSFSAAALLLALAGIYGVISYSVAQRTREIGVRMALGASAREVLRMVLKQGVLIGAIGVAAGILGSLALTRWMRAQLFEISSTDPATFVGAAFLLVAVALLACWVPARRAAKVDPMVALRYE